MEFDTTCTAWKFVQVFFIIGCVAWPLAMVGVVKVTWDEYFGN